VPIHNHECEHCGRTEIVCHSIREDPVWPECCGEGMPRVYDRPFSTGVFDKPIEMQSIGCNSWEEIHDFKRKCPGIEMSTDPNDELFGVPIAKTRQEKLKALKATGFVERK